MSPISTCHVVPLLTVLKAALSHLAEQLCLQYEFALLVLLARLICLVVLPANRLLALLAEYIAYDVSPRCHVAFSSISRSDVHHIVKQVRLAMLTSEVLQNQRISIIITLVALSSCRGEREKSYPADDVVMVREVCFAVLASIDLV